ncbi:uncharacterized protein LOC143891972 [Tasmannia lanceolata]|uniref:uncharacterized protein LOC143891972 n=1 Tax=Tasmannia lanceolata TaxID=3420 RepID=UPI004063F3C5
MTIDDDNSIYVGGIPYDSSEVSIRSVFDFYGAVVAVKIINDCGVGGKCYGFVTFTNPRSAIDAINDMNGRTIGGRIVRENEVRTRGGRLTSNRETFHRDMERDISWDRDRDRGRDRDHTRDRHRDCYSDRSSERDREREREYEHGRDHDSTRDRIMDEDRDDQDQEHNKNHDRDRDRDRNWSRGNLIIEGDSSNAIAWASVKSKRPWKLQCYIAEIRDVVRLVLPKIEHRRRSVNEMADQLAKGGVLREELLITSSVGVADHFHVIDRRSRELSSNSSNEYLDQVREQLEISVQRHEELQNEIDQIKEKFEEKQQFISDLQKKYQKLEDALATAKKISSQRNTQLTKVQRCFSQVKDCTERLKNYEQELQSHVVDMRMVEADDGEDSGIMVSAALYANGKI